MKILIFTDSRGQHKPRGSTHEIFPYKLAKDERLTVDLFLCPFKWTTTLDFLASFDKNQLLGYDLIILYTGIVDWSPRPFSNALNDVYNNPSESNVGNLSLNTDNYNHKIVNNKKAIFDQVFGGSEMQAHFTKPFDATYEGEQTINMYSLEMASKHLLPRILNIPNLLFINVNRFVKGWDGDYWKKRPDNIYITHQYAELFSQVIPKDNIIDLLEWADEEVKSFTCDNLHLSEAGSEYIYRKVVDRINRHFGRCMIEPASENIMSALKSPVLKCDELAKVLTKEELALCKKTTLIIGVRLQDADETRIGNLRYLLSWLFKYYASLFDILVVEQDKTPRFKSSFGDVPDFIRYVFLFNPHDYNRGWGYNVAVKHHCENADVVVLMDTDVLTGDGFVESILACHQEFVAVSPYRNIYYSNKEEVEKLRSTYDYSVFARTDAIKNPVTITGGIVAIKKSAFLEVNGFEQYIGYGCEDRALDVTLLNKFGKDKTMVVDEVYLHLYHKPDRGARKNFDKIYEHLTSNYGCSYDPKITPIEYIHKGCNHTSRSITDLLIEKRSRSFGDPDLYLNEISKLTANGMITMDQPVSDSEALLPRLHKSLAVNRREDAYKYYQLGLSRYRDNKILLDVFKSKLSEIDRASKSIKEVFQKTDYGHSDTLVILGNGPSLKYVMGNPDYRKFLRKYHTFGLNAAYRAYDELEFWPTYHGCLDMIVVESHLQEYKKILPKLKQMFLLSEDHLGNDIIGFEHPNLTKIRFDPAFRDNNEKIVSERYDKFRNWQNSGCNCVQIGFMLGYKRVILLGMDASYKEVLNEADVIKDEKYKWDHLKITKEVKDNDNYWFAGYQQVGDKYNIPNANKYHLPAWNALGLSAHSSKILNCTTKTKIETIFRRSFEEVFDVIPSYPSLSGVPRLLPIGVTSEKLVGQIVLLDKRLYYIDRVGTKIIRRFTNVAVFETLLVKYPTLHVIEGNQSLLDLPCQGLLSVESYNKDSLRPGLTFMIRARNERQNIYFVLGSLKHILANDNFNCDLLFADNLSNDGTYQEVLRVCHEQRIKNVYLTKYDVDVCRSGEQHTKLSKDEMYRSLDTYYNWCLDRVMTHYVIKWDCDFLAIQANLIKMIMGCDLHSSDRPLAIWCAGKTLFKSDGYYLNEETMYNEFRVFSKLRGYRWQYAPRWEICSQDYMSKAEKLIYTPCVYLELKNLSTNEFEFRSGGSAIVSDIRDSRDASIVKSLSTGDDNSEHNNLQLLEFNPTSPSMFDAPILRSFEATNEELDAMQSYWVNVYSRPHNPFRFKHKGNAVIQGLWVGEQISNFHRLCIESFLKNGHCFVLYTYEPVKNLPVGVVIKDANKIVPSSLIYQYDGSYAGFSDLFRNKLLYSQGGWYVDLDIYCLRPFDIDQEIVFSLDHYHADAVKVKKGTKEIVEDKYYVQTNPCKLPAGHDIAFSMYSFIFKKIVFDKLKTIWLGDTPDAPEAWLKGEVPSSVIVSAITKLFVSDDFERFVGPISKIPPKLSFYKLLDIYGISPKDVGQKTWGEIGPIMITREVVSRGLEKYTTKPEMFQGIVKYFEIERFVDPSFDYLNQLKTANPYSLDLFYTMWRRKNLLDKFDTQENCLLKYIRESVKVESA